MGSQIFISYSSQEEPEARRVKSVLEENGFSCWMAPDSIPSGSNYKKEIPSAIRQCEVVLFIMSDKSQKSIWVQKEIENAIKENKRIVPYKIEDCPLEDDFDFVLHDVQQVFAYNDEEAALRKVIMDLRKYLSVHEDEEIRITVENRKKRFPKIPALIGGIALIALIGFLAIRAINPRNQIVIPDEAHVYYSEVLPYTSAGYYESFTDTKGEVKNSLNISEAFSILSFIRNPKESAAFVESVSCDLLEVEADLRADVLIDFHVIDNNILKIFAVNNGWGDSGDFEYSLKMEEVQDLPEFPKLKESLKDTGICSVEKENAVLLGEYLLNIEDVKQWADANMTNTARQIGTLFVSFVIDGEERTAATYLYYDKVTKSISIGYGGKGDNLDYSVTLYAMLDVDNPPASIHFTGNNASPLVQDTFRIETVIIPTKSVSLKCQGVYSVDGNIQKTEVYDIHVKVPVFKEGSFTNSGHYTKQLAEISMADTERVKEILSEARYNPESLLEDHVNP